MSVQSTAPKQQYLTQLRENLCQAFNIEELRTLCGDLGIDYENISQGAKEVFCREMISYMERRDRLPELITHCKQLRPLIRWEEGSGVSDPSILANESPNAPISFAPNPFGISGRITNPADFFDREDLLRRIFEALRKGSNLSLVGESQMGKSSILSMICQMGPAQLHLPAKAFVYLDMQCVHSEDDFFEALCDKLGVAVCRGYKLERALRGKRFVLCLDEIEKMTDRRRFKGEARAELRGFADGADQPLMLVIASRTPLSQLFEDSPGMTSPLAGICPPMDVLPFTPDIARQFIQQRLQGTGVVFAPGEVHDLVSQSRGHPGRLHQLAAALYSRHTTR